MLTFRLPHIL